MSREKTKSAMKLIPPLAIILAVASGVQIAHAACGLALNSTSLDFGSIARGGGPSIQKTLELQNTGGDTATVTASGKNWLDGSAVSHIYGNYTKFAVNSDAVPDASATAYSEKTPLNSTDGAVTLGTIGPSSANATYWQVQGTLHNLPFFGIITQVITFTAQC